MKQSFIRAAVVAAGPLYTISGAALLLAPEWFYQNVGTYPPYNRHYEGDVGAFLLPLGLILLWAARRPERHVALITFTALGSVLHAANHLYDDVIAQASLQSIFSATVPLIIFALVLVVASLWAGQQRAAVEVIPQRTSSPDRVTSSR